MKKKQIPLFVTLSSIALLGVLVIQVHWIFRTAEMKEALFNEKAGMVLARTTEALGSDEATCQKISSCEPAAGQSNAELPLEAEELHKIDSLFRYYLRFYNVHLDYSFSVAKPSSTEPVRSEAAVYNKPLDDFINKSGVRLNLVFPDRNQYLLAEMGLPFFTSVVLILVVLVLFWTTIRSLVKEKEISEHTTDFLNNMTHEFKTPITNISLAGKMMVRDSNIRQEEKVRHYSDIILEENDKLRQQVEQVLSLAALERGEIPMVKTEFDFHQLFPEALRCTQMQIDNTHGHLETHLQAENSFILGDKTHIANALSNLLDNAVKHSGAHPKLILSTFNEGNEFVFRVQDHGIGIKKEYHKKIFDTYFRVPTGAVHNVKGFGLGLAYVKKIVEGHQGSVSLESEVGKGAVFTVRIPYVEATV